jgi:hypothetical protein
MLPMFGDQRIDGVAIASSFSAALPSRESRRAREREDAADRCSDRAARIHSGRAWVDTHTVFRLGVLKDLVGTSKFACSFWTFVQLFELLNEAQDLQPGRHRRGRG